ncbi:unnamed protein product [Lactuca virosa]|uniref:Uncharacterized protein n=1 Tax=Lactuca virosa TaxID=75947 RepID=A0AAU9MQN8_9ASTR|nr:unnamed protein product [Lactuca virosa]
MIPELESIKGGGGSIKIGTTGTISALMSRELHTVEDASSNSAIEASSSNSSNTNEKNTDTCRKTKTHKTRKSGRNPNRRKGSYIVEVVDIKCRMPDPITNRLKKLNFSKLSETNS